MQSIIHLENISKSYYLGKEPLPVLKGINLDIFKNEYVALMGPSGSGKSTLMNILGCLDSPTSGKYILNGKIKMTGLHIPTSKEIYEPVLAELEKYEVKFQEEKKESTQRT